MTKDEQRKILEAAAKACGIEYWVVKFSPRSAPIEKIHTTMGGETVEWNPITNSADTASMCAKLDINTFFYPSTKKVECWSDDHGDEQTTGHVTAYNGTSEGKLKAWMEAATIVAAKIGGEEE